MRILFINSIQMFGGGEVWMLRTLRALQAAGHEVWLCCRPHTELAARAVQQGIPVKLVRFRGDFDPLCTGVLAWFMWRQRIEVVLTNMDKELRNGGVAARLAGVPAIIPRRGIDHPLKNRWRYRFAYNVLATRVLANSEATKRALLRHAPWLDPGRIEVIYNGIEVEAFARTPQRQFRREWGIAAHTPVLGFVGQLDERKGLEVLLAAFALILEQVPEARLVMAGEGQLRQRIEDEICARRWQDRVILTGFVDEIAALMSALDVLVLPSYWEGFGIVIIEAMAAGRPVVTTNTSSMPEIVDEGRTGFLVPPGAAPELAARVITLLQQPALRAAFGEAARARVQAVFSHAVMMAHLQDLFQREAARPTWRRPRRSAP